MSDSSKIYPRGIPFKAPETVTARPAEPAPAAAQLVEERLRDEFARQEARLRRWVQILVLSTVAALAIVVGIGFVLVRQIKGQAANAEPPVAKDDRPAPQGKREPAPEKRDPAPATPKTDPVPGSVKEKPPETGKPDPQRERLLGALGNLTGIHLYQAY